MTSITITGTQPIQKLEFTPQERLSLVVEALLQEFTPEEAHKIQGFWDLYAYLHREKQRILQLLLSSKKDKTRQVLWAQLDEVKSDINSLEIFLEVHIKQDN
jgi:hypothetical protein